MMSEAEKYEGYKWIKVKREDPTVIGDKIFVSEEHHVKETGFLIDTVRELASRIDNLKKSLKRLRLQEQKRNSYDNQRASYDADYLPYEEDHRE
jgi:hypothetical protein